MSKKPSQASIVNFFKSNKEPEIEIIPIADPECSSKIHNKVQILESTTTVPLNLNEKEKQAFTDFSQFHYDTPIQSVLKNYPQTSINGVLIVVIFKYFHG